MASSGQHYSEAYLNQYIGHRLVACAIAFIVIDTFVFAVRCLSRFRLKRSDMLGWDDAIMPLAYSFQIGFCALAIVMVNYGGAGHHLVAVEMRDPGALTIWAKCIVAVTVIYQLAVALPKLALLALYLRVLISKTARIVTWILVALTVALALSFIIASLADCEPFAYNWDKTIPGGHCVNLEAIYKSYNPPAIAIDLGIIAVPIPTIWKLRMSTSRRIGLIAIFSAGLLGTVAGAVRLAIFFQNDAFVDGTWASIVLVAWTLVEPSMYFLASCMPGCRAIFPYLSYDSLRSRFSRGSSNGSSSGRSGNRYNKAQYQLHDRDPRDRKGFAHRLQGESALDTNASADAASDGMGDNIQSAFDFGGDTQRAKDSIISVRKDVWVTPHSRNDA